ncbi:cytochrome c oxidase assembly protein COX16 homolog l(3)neo43 isoform X1 [Colletes latitarsis]|uniref:cytochrome c oxidase assembly protein COX16 homolog l(3)neo43 isoform X1 n=1 Tax=Colletes latitarsis TaxID=2605962 RepID=UPI004035656F
MSRFYEGKIFKHFLPFMILVIGGSFLIREFTAIKYKYRKISSYEIKKEFDKKGIKMNEILPLETEYENLKKLDIDNWSNVRIPRPWEETENTKN